MSMIHPLKLTLGGTGVTARLGLLHQVTISLAGVEFAERKLLKRVVLALNSPLADGSSVEVIREGTRRSRSASSRFCFV